MQAVHHAPTRGNAVPIRAATVREAMAHHVRPVHVDPVVRAATPVQARRAATRRRVVRAARAAIAAARAVLGARNPESIKNGEAFASPSGFDLELKLFDQSSFKPFLLLSRRLRSFAA